MDLWKVLVLGTLRLNCDWNYDKLQDIANNHRTLRLLYERQVSLLSVQIEDRAGFILNHVVLDHETDEKIALAVVREKKSSIPHCTAAVSIKGFRPPEI